MKKSVLAIVLVVLIVAVSAVAWERWGVTRYGAVTHYGNPYMYQSYDYPYYDYPGYVDFVGSPAYAPTYFRYAPAYNPFGNYRYSYMNPLSGDYMYRYGLPQTEYAAVVQNLELPAAQGNLCGTFNGRAYGCQYGLTCDYTKVNAAGLGACMPQ